MLETAIDELWQRHQTLDLVTPHDPEWPSPCEVGQPWDGPDEESLTRWQPVKRHPSAQDFDGLEAALEVPIHPDVKTYYGRYWAANLDASAPDGDVSLLFLWNQPDVDRLIENLIGHAVACRYNKTPFAVFFAVPDTDEDLFLSINNNDGSIQLEQPAKPPLRTVAGSLAEFLASLKPRHSRYDN